MNLGMAHVLKIKCAKLLNCWLLPLGYMTALFVALEVSDERVGAC